MKILSNIIKSKYFLLYALAVLNLVVALYVIEISFWSSDSETYLSAMKFLQGDRLSKIPYNRLITTPFMLYASIFFGYFTGGLFKGMLAVNLIFYFLIIYVFYKLAFEICQDNKTAFLSSVLFLGNYAIYNFGIAYTADMGGWFFFVLSSLLAVKYFYNNNSRKFYFLAILSSSIGVLFKEYGALGLISLCLLILASAYGWRKKIKEIITAGFLFALIPLLYNLIFYLKFNYSYLDWYFFNVDAHGQSYNLILLIKVLGWLYLAGWPIFFYGLWQEKKYFEKTRATVLAALLPASLAFLAWPALTQRVAFIIVPWLALISGFGLTKLKNNYLIAAILIIYIIINYSITPFLLDAINLPF